MKRSTLLRLLRQCLSESAWSLPCDNGTATPPVTLSAMAVAAGTRVDDPHRTSSPAAGRAAQPGRQLRDRQTRRNPRPVDGRRVTAGITERDQLELLGRGKKCGLYFTCATAFRLRPRSGFHLPFFECGARGACRTGLGPVHEPGSPRQTPARDDDQSTTRAQTLSAPVPCRVA